MQTVHSPEANNIQETPNGAFFRGLDVQAGHDSSLVGAVNAVKDQYIGEGELGFALKYMKDYPRVFGHNIVLSDYWQNEALGAMAVVGKSKDFDDTTSNGGPRTVDMYLRKIGPDEVDENNRDKRFDGLRPIGFEIKDEQEPVMAIVALDPSKLETVKGGVDKPALLEELKTLREAVMTKRDVDRMFSPELTTVLEACLLANDAVVNTHAEDGSVIEWSLPFDKIASIKALYVLLSGDDNSGAMRQGAVRMKDEEGTEIIVGCSGLNSAIDETAARAFATDVLSHANTHAHNNTPQVV